MKILLQKLWERNLELDEPVPTKIVFAWKKWYQEFPELRNHLIAQSYFVKEVEVVSIELQRFCDASGGAYSGVIYLSSINTKADVHVSLVLAKTKVGPLRRLLIPHLELRSGVSLSKVLSHVADMLDLLYSR